jgi:hypothetical protein
MSVGIGWKVDLAGKMQPTPGFVDSAANCVLVLLNKKWAHFQHCHGICLPLK